MSVKNPTVSCVILTACLIALCAADPVPSRAQGPKKEVPVAQVRHTLPQSILQGPFRFAGQQIPIQRPDVRYRIECQVNFLLMDARSVLTEWFTQMARYSWVFEEIFSKQGLPKDFALLAPVISSLNVWSQPRGTGVGWWSLSSPCTASEGLEMFQDSWHDDRMDLELSTRCFVSRIKNVRKEVDDPGWFMAVTAYLTSTKAVKELEERWNTKVFWDLPLPDNVEELVVRWIALGVIDSHRSEYGLTFKEPQPFTFDQVSGLLLAKDLSIAEIAKMTGTPPREILSLNPKIKPSQGVFPARVRGKQVMHTLAAPKGKGQALVNKLKEGGYLADAGKR